MTIKDKTLSLDAQLAAVQAHIEDLEVPYVDVARVFARYSNTVFFNLFNHAASFRGFRQRTYMGFERNLTPPN